MGFLELHHLQNANAPGGNVTTRVTMAMIASLLMLYIGHFQFWIIRESMAVWGARWEAAFKMYLNIVGDISLGKMERTRAFLDAVSVEVNY